RVGSLDRLAVKETAAMEDRLLVEDAGDTADKLQKRRFPLGWLPVQPSHVVVLAISVVVAALGAQHFIAALQHGDALGQEKRRQDAPHFGFPYIRHLVVLGRTFLSAIPTVVVVLAVAILFAIGFVVLLVVGNQVVQGKAVVASDEVDAGVRPAAA